MKKIFLIFIFYLLFLFSGCAPLEKNYTLVIEGDVYNIKENAEFVLPTLTKEGYDFVGFKDEQNNLYTEKIIVKKNSVLTPVFKIKEFTISFFTEELKNQEQFANFTVNFGDILVKPKLVPEKDHHEFLYWSDTKNGSEFVFNRKALKNIKLFPVFRYVEKYYKVSFDLTDILNPEDFPTLKCKEMTKIPVITSIPIKTNYIFKHFSLTPQGPKFDFNTLITKDTFLYPVFEKKLLFHEIKFETAFLTNPEKFKTQIVKDGEQVIKPTVEPKISGEVFQYFSLTPNGSEYNFSMPVTKSITLYPVFSGFTYQITIVNGEYKDVFSSKQELIKVLLSDFFDFLEPEDTRTDFTSLLYGNWKQKYYLHRLFIENNKISKNAPFFKNALYKERWLNFFTQFSERIKKDVSTNKFFGGTENDFDTFIKYVLGKEHPDYNGQTIPNSTMPFTEDVLNFYMPLKINQKLNYKLNEELKLKPLYSEFKFIGFSLDGTRNKLVKNLNDLPLGKVKLYPVKVSDSFKEVEVIHLDGSSEKMLIGFNSYNVIKQKPGDYEFILINDKLFLNRFFCLEDALNDKIKFLPFAKLKYENGDEVKYRSGDNAYALKTYTKKQNDVRGVWVSFMTGDVEALNSDKTHAIKVVDNLVDKLVKLKLNHVFFHLRTHNNALYYSKYAPMKYVNNKTAKDWDYLKYFITKCHENNIFVHAWLNPYRLSDADSVDEIVKNYKNYPLNPASKAENILKGAKTSKYILDPSKEAVKNFLLNVIGEICDNYEIDGIHFDDYFYIPLMGDPNGQLSSAVQAEREGHVNDFVRRVYHLVREKERAKNYKILFGISPTGVYRIGNGKVTYDELGNAITNGSPGGWGHYHSKLCCDSLYWINNEIIDYIAPQVYWSMSHKSAPHHDISLWWNKVVRYKRVKVLTGIGVYKYTESSAYGWKNNGNEIENQVLFNHSLANVDGIIFFRLAQLWKVNIDESNIHHNSLKKVINNYWK